MTSWTWSLEESGPIEFFELKSDQIAAIQQQLSQLQPAGGGLPDAICMTCANARKTFSTVIDGAEVRLIDIVDNVTFVDSRRVIDPSNNFTSFYKNLFSQLQQTTTPQLPADIRSRLEGSMFNPDLLDKQGPFIKPGNGLTKPVEGFTKPGGPGGGNIKPAALAKSKDVAADQQPPDLGALRFEPCSCGGPEDFDHWARSKTMRFNSCFNFAVKDCWTDHVGGATPSAYPSHEVDNWVDCLKDVGMRLVADENETPAGASADGWHVALALKTKDNPTKTTNFHFLRLDGDHWSHKWSSKAPQLCDLAGKAIPKDKLRSAELCGYEVKRIFWVDGKLSLPQPK